MMILFCLFIGFIAGAFITTRGLVVSAVTRRLIQVATENSIRATLDVLHEGHRMGLSLDEVLAHAEAAYDEIAIHVRTGHTAEQRSQTDPEHATRCVLCDHSVMPPPPPEMLGDARGYYYIHGFADGVHSALKVGGPHLCARHRAMQLEALAARGFGVHINENVTQ